MGGMLVVVASAYYQRFCFYITVLHTMADPACDLLKSEKEATENYTQQKRVGCHGNPIRLDTIRYSRERRVVACDITSRLQGCDRLSLFGLYCSTCLTYKEKGKSTFYTVLQ